MASLKIAKNGPADEIELSVAQALFDLENNVADLKKELKALQISSAKEVSFFPFLYSKVEVSKGNLEEAFWKGGQDDLTPPQISTTTNVNICSGSGRREFPVVQVQESGKSAEGGIRMEGYLHLG